MRDKMICVKLRVFGSLAEVLPPACFLRENATVRDLLSGLDDAARRLLLQAEAPEQLCPGVLILLNDISVAHLNGLDSPLHDGDIVQILFADLVGG